MVLFEPFELKSNKRFFFFFNRIKEIVLIKRRKRKKVWFKVDKVKKKKSEN